MDTHFSHACTINQRRHEQQKEERRPIVVAQKNDKVQVQRGIYARRNAVNGLYAFKHSAPVHIPSRSDTSVNLVAIAQISVRMGGSNDRTPGITNVAEVTEKTLDPTLQKAGRFDELPNLCASFDFKNPSSMHEREKFSAQLPDWFTRRLVSRIVGTANGSFNPAVELESPYTAKTVGGSTTMVSLSTTSGRVAVTVAITCRGHAWNSTTGFSESVAVLLRPLSRVVGKSTSNIGPSTLTTATLDAVADSAATASGYSADALGTRVPNWRARKTSSAHVRQQGPR